jgi:hypothetical protein
VRWVRWRLAGAIAAVGLASTALWLRQADDALLRASSFGEACKQTALFAAPTIVLYVLLVRSDIGSMVAGALLGGLLIATWWGAATDWHSTASVGPALMGWLLGPTVAVAAAMAERRRTS